MFLQTILSRFATNFAESQMFPQVARQGRRNLGALLAISVNMVACCLFIYFVFLDDVLVLSAFFIPPSAVATFHDLLWIVGVNDFVLKFLAVLAKVVVTVLPASVLQYQKRGKYFLFLEVSSQLHRQLAPLQVLLMLLLLLMLFLLHCSFFSSCTSCSPLLLCSSAPLVPRPSPPLLLHCSSCCSTVPLLLQPWLMYLLAATDATGGTTIPNKVC